MKNTIFVIVFLFLLHDLIAQNTIKLDKSFGKNGFVRTSLSGNGNTMFASNRKSFVTPDNKILVVGEFNAEVMITRMFAVGGIDSSYGSNGFSDHVNIQQPTAAIQPDGKIIVAGSNGKVNEDFILARFNTNGSLDKSFGNGGVIITDLGSDDDIPYAVVVQNNGRIIAAGQSFVNGVSQFALIRYNPNGTTDMSFGKKGIVFTNFGNTSSINALALNPNGKIIAVGNYFNGSNGDFAIAQYNSDGTLDPSFNGTGEVVADFGNSDNAVSAAIQKDGMIVVGGYYVDASYNSHFEIARFQASGSLDVSFNGSGYTTTDFGNSQDYLAAIAIQSNGGIVAGGYTYDVNGISDLALARFTSQGAIDNNFGNAGRQVTNIDGGYDFMNCLLVQSNGKILSGGYNSSGANYLTLVQYNTNGTLNTDFGSGGYIIGYYPAKDITYSNVFVQTDEKLVTNGQTYDGATIQNILSRFNQDGSVDKSYGQKGIANSGGFYAAMQSDNKVVNAGYTNTASGTEIVMSRYYTNGSIDQTYGTNGMTIVDFFDGNESVGPIAIQKDNKVVISGYIYNDVGSDLLMARFNLDGTPDASFGNGGAMITDFEPYDFDQALAIRDDGEILFAGVGYTTDFQLVATLGLFKPNGSLDSTFGQNGKIIIAGGVEAFSGSVAFQKDGKILFDYDISTDFSNFSSFINRYNPDGTLDNSFGQNGTVSVDGAIIILQKDQKILVAGRMTNLQNNFDFTISRYNTNGSKDITFGSQGTIVTSFTPGDDIIASMILNGNRLFAAGYCLDPNGKGLLAKYILNSESYAADSIIQVLEKTQTEDITGWVITATPNPSNASFQVNIKSAGDNQTVNLRLINLQGNVEQTISSVQTGQSVMIGGPALSSGIYILQVIGKDSFKTMKLVKF